MPETNNLFGEIEQTSYSLATRQTSAKPSPQRMPQGAVEGRILTVEYTRLGELMGAGLSVENRTERQVKKIYQGLF